MSNTWDYIVVGGGHNGLSAACTLAESKASVLVVEQLPFLGGLSASHAYVKAAPQHLLSLGAMDDMFMGQSTLAEDLRLPHYGYQGIKLEHPYGWMNEDGDTLLLFEDFERTVRDIQYFSPKDAVAYRELRPAIDFILDLQDRYGVQQTSAMGKWDMAGLALKLARNRSLRKALGRMYTASVFEMISETFQSDAMRGLWAFWTGMICPGDMDSTGLYMSAFGGVHRGGVRRPKGGMTGLMSAFANNLQDHGGEVRAGTAVERIVVRDNRATGVRLVDGSVLNARRGVLSSCAPQLTLGKLLEPGTLDRQTSDKVKFIPANYLNAAAFKIDVAVGGPLSYPRAQAKRAQRDSADIRKTTYMTGTLEDPMAQLDLLKLGSNVAVPPVYMAILSAADPSIAPPGQDVLYLNSTVPAVPSGGWDARKAEYSATIRRSAKRFLSGLDAELGGVESSPADFESRFGTPRGCYFHVDMIPTRMGANRPAPGLGGYTTPVEALFISGAGTHPGGGVSGWPGRLAAQRALKG